MMLELILASQSPRRRQLVNLLGCSVTAVAADVDETQITTPDPAQNTIDTARLKADTILAQWRRPAADARPSLPRPLLLAADTTVALGRQMLGKPHDAETAVHTLRLLRQQRHDVYTGMVIVDMASGHRIEDVTSVSVTMRNYSDVEIAAYVATGDPLDKAGAYAIQHPVFRPVARLHGCYLGVMGLSICHLRQVLQRLDIPVSVDRERLRQAHAGYPCPYIA
ncbi:MAG: Maf family protein [Chloroflexota bacterium]|jgi:septum formation protein